jgi:hypothetical protein
MYTPNKYNPPTSSKKTRTRDCIRISYPYHRRGHKMSALIGY